MMSAQALSEMFADGDDRHAWLRQCDPTDPQAEVIVFEAVEPHLIEAIAFETSVSSKRHGNLLAGRESFYAGVGKGLFAAREHTIKN